MGKGFRDGVIRNTVQAILVGGTDQPSAWITKDLFYHQNSIDMAIDWRAVKAMSLAQLLEYPEFKQQFINMYDCHKGMDYYIGGEAFYEQEVAFMLTLFRDNAKLAASTVISVATAMISGVAYHGLSIEPVSKGMAYLIPTPQNVAGRGQAAQWIDTCKFRISAYGELELRRRSGVITHVKNPIMVYEGDTFETALRTVHGRTKMEIVQHIPKRKSEKITHAYIILSLPGGDEDIKVFSMEEIQGFRRLNKNEAMRDSPMWTGGFGGQPLRGTIEAKVIKHAFSTYPRINIGVSGVSLETDIIDRGEDAVVRQFDRDAQLADVMAGAPSDEEDTGWVSGNGYNEQEQEDEIPEEWRPPAQQQPAKRSNPPQQQTARAEPPPSPKKTQAPGFDF